MASEKDEVSLVMQCDDLATLIFRGGRKHALEERRASFTEWCRKSMKVKFRSVIGGVTVAADFLAGDKVANAKVKGGAFGKDNDCEGRRLFVVVVNHNEVSIWIARFVARFLIREGWSRC